MQTQFVGEFEFEFWVFFEPMYVSSLVDLYVAASWNMLLNINFWFNKTSN